jgi:hypothetical protein
MEFWYKDKDGQEFSISKYIVEYDEDSGTFSVCLYEKEWDENGKEYFQVGDEEFATYDEVLDFLKMGNVWQ